MKKNQQLLFGLLFAQILLAVGIFAFQRLSHTKPVQEPLLTAKKIDIDKFIIADANQQVEVLKNGNDWTVPALKQLPADKQKVEDMLNKLDATRLFWPVTNTASAHERFEVADNKFQRKISYYQGDKKLGEFFIGTSPGFKQSHVRNASGAKVYAVELNSADFSVNALDWFKKSLVSAQGVTGIKGKDYEIHKILTDWKFATGDAKIDSQKAEGLANAFGSLQVSEIAETVPRAEPIEITLTTTSGELHYSFIFADNAAFVKRNDRSQWFKIPPYDYNQTAKITAADLILKADPKAASNSSDEAATKATDEIHKSEERLL